MTTVTIDKIIRKHLAKKGIPLHYYVDYLLLAQDCLRDMHFDTLQSLEVTTLPVDADTDLVNLPADCVEPILVGIEVGDKIRPLSEDYRVNDRQNSTNDLDFPEGSDYRGQDEISHSNYGVYLDSFYTTNREFRGRAFGFVPTYDQSYRILRDSGQLRINNKNNDVTDIYLSYLSSFKQVSSQSVVHPYAENAMYVYMDWKAADNTNNASLAMYKKREFTNEHRKLRARMAKWSPQKIIRSARRYYQASIKN